MGYGASWEELVPKQPSTTVPSRQPRPQLVRAPDHLGRFGVLERGREVTGGRGSRKQWLC